MNMKASIGFPLAVNTRITRDVLTKGETYTNTDRSLLHQAESGWSDGKKQQ